MVLVSNVFVIYETFNVFEEPKINPNSFEVLTNVWKDVTREVWKN